MCQNLLKLIFKWGARKMLQSGQMGVLGTDTFIGQEYWNEFIDGCKTDSLVGGVVTSPDWIYL